MITDRGHLISLNRPASQRPTLPSLVGFVAISGSAAGRCSFTVKAQRPPMTFRCSRIFRQLSVGTVVVAVCGAAAVFSNAVANADPPPVDGSLTLSQSSGTAADKPSVHTPAACPDTAGSYDGLVTGPNGFNGIFVNNESAAIGFKDGPFDVPFSLDMGSISQSIGVPLVTGEYDLVLECVDGGTGDRKRAWSTAMIFDTPDHWTAFSNGTPSGTPTPTPSTTETPTPTPSTTETPTPTPSTTETPTPTPSTTETPTPTPSTTPAPGATATTTTLRVFPNPAFQGFPMIFLVNVVPLGASGTVQLMDGTTALGAPMAAPFGFAFGITALPQGTHSLTAVFTPSDSADFAPSTSSPVSLRVRSLFGGLGGFWRIFGHR
jgi:hypothetical protein